MRGKLIVITGVMALGLSACGHRGVIRWEGVVVQRLSDPQRLR